MSTFQCTECGASVLIPARLKTVNCTRCGDANFITNGVVRRVHPALHMLPVDAPLPHANYPLSIWMLPWTRPVKRGNYHVRFRHLEPQVFVAFWTGVAFVDTTGRRINMRDFLTWRGLLA